MSNDIKNTAEQQQNSTECTAQIKQGRIEYLEKEKSLSIQWKTLGCETAEEFLNLPKDVQAKHIELCQSTKSLLIERDQLWPEDAVTHEFNQKHAVVRVGNHTAILTHILNPIFGTPDIIFETRESFRQFNENQQVRCSDGKMRPKADIWLKSSQRRTYHGITFDPSTIGDVRGCYNLWQGFAIKPCPGDCSKYWFHVLYVICSGDEKLYCFVRKWTAYMFQHPDEVHTALVIIGPQGIGKNCFVDPLGVLFGVHFFKLSSISELLSHFNIHLKNAVLINLNEAFWTHSRKDIGSFKSMVTEEVCAYEGKGKDAIQARNYRHFIITSNEDLPILLDHDDRRSAVLRIKDNQQQDPQYFKELHDQLKNGGYEALLHDLLNEDLTGFDPRKLPQNSYDKFAMSIRSADSSHRYIHDALREGHFGIGPLSSSTTWIWGPTPKNGIYADYKNWCEANGERTVISNTFHQDLAKLIPSLDERRPRKNGGRFIEYQFPSLEQARIEFCTKYKMSVDQVFHSGHEGGGEQT